MDANVGGRILIRNRSVSVVIPADRQNGSRSGTIQSRFAFLAGNSFLAVIPYATEWIAFLPALKILCRKRAAPKDTTKERWLLSKFSASRRRENPTAAVVLLWTFLWLC